MDPETLAEILSKSASSLYGYLEDMQFMTDPPLGVGITEVVSYDVGKGYAVLHLRSLIQDTGSIMLMIDSDLLQEEEAGFTRYDEITKTILIRPEPAVLSRLSISHPRLLIVSDMKFLIKSVKTFIDLYGDSIRLPDADPIYSEPVFPPGSAPSGQQREAVANVLSNRLAYVWGAPGTGKTQFVLAACVKTCIDGGMRIALFAPTNNSVEQMLRGILAAFSEKTLGGKILRLGIPSKSFLAEHPEMCENRQAQKRTERIAECIGNLKEILFERNCARIRKKMESITKVPGSGKDEETGKETGFRDAISEAQSALCDRDRPALSIPEYGKMTDQDIIQLMLRLTREKERLSSECTDRRLADVSVIAGTPLQFVSRFRPRGSADDGRMELDADRIFLDEAGYCSLMHAILLFSNGVPVTFLGDHMQLPPVCEIGRDMILSWMERNTAMKNVFLWDMNALYCEELLTKNPDSIIYSYRSGREAYLGLTKLSELTETRRFGPDLAEILDNFVYRNGMKGNAGSGLRIICINAVCGERRDRENEAEKDSVLEYLESEDPEPSETAVLTPYSSQAKLLKHNLGKYSDCVMTVHSSQGREWDTVIISVADNGSGEKEVPLRFTSSETPIGLRVINTAVSRVRKNLVIVCDRNYWIHKDGELVCEIIKKAELRVPEREKYNGNR